MWLILEVLPYCQISNIRSTKSDNFMFLVSSCRYACSMQWSQVLSREWRCSWSSADMRCSNYIWVINKFIAYRGVPYIRDLTVNIPYWLICYEQNLHHVTHIKLIVAKGHYLITWIRMNIDSRNGLLPDGTKPLPEPMLTYQSKVQSNSSGDNFTVDT